MICHVDFHLISATSLDDRNQYICETLETLYLSGQRVFVNTDAINEAHTLDELLWTFKIESFIPHNCADETEQPTPPIQFGSDITKATPHTVLMNLAPTIPVIAGHYKKIIEIVHQDENAKTILRDHYKYYKQNGYQVSVRDLVEKSVENADCT